MIVITGGSGQLGREIVQRLAQRVAPTQIAVSVRDPERASDLRALGVRVRRGDFTDPKSLLEAFEGASQILLVSSNARAHGGDALAQHRAAIEAARQVGAKRVVYTSHMAASPTSAFTPMHDHAATEEMLRGSGLAWTALRHGFYASSGIAIMGNAFESGVLAAPEDGKVSWTAHADLAEAAAIILDDEGRFDGPTPPLTGAAALDFGDLAQIASELQDKPIRRRIITDAALRAGMQARGVPDTAIEIATGLYLAARNGELAQVDPTLERLLGRKPVAMRSLIAAKISRA